MSSHTSSSSTFKPKTHSSELPRDRKGEISPIPSDHIAKLWNGISGLLINPYKNAINYFFPFIGAFFGGYHKLHSDPTLCAMMPECKTNKILKEIEVLANCAGIQRTISPYVALNHCFSSSGGGLSVTSPALFIPYQHLFRQDEKSSFGEEQSIENLKDNIWVFSDDETRFLIARELGQIKENSGLLRIAIKVSVLTALFFILTSPFGWPLGMTLFIGVLGIYVISERFFQARADIVAATILGKKIGDPKQAIQIGIEVMQKIQKQNQYRYHHSNVAKLYISKDGTNLMDFEHPSPVSREEKLRSLL